MTILHLDYETYSEVDIKRAGAHKYTKDPSTEVLMLGWAIDDEDPQLWQPRKGPMPSELRDAFLDPTVTLIAFNAQFERLVTRYVLGIDVPLNRWRCAMVMAYYLGYSGGLDDVCEQIGIRGKDPRGGRLVQLFSKPAPKNHKAGRYTWQNRPSDWEDFCAYCLRDVEVERELVAFFEKFPAVETWDWEQWLLDQRINDRGVPLDVGMAQGAVELWSRERERLSEDLQNLTGLPKVTRGPFMNWLKSNWVDVPDLRKDTLQALDITDPTIRQAVDLWQLREAKAVAKYTAMLNGVEKDGRVRGMFQYKGASRTDRVGGRRVQVQNLKRPMAKTPDDANTVADLIRTGDPALLRALYDEPVSEVIGCAVRHAICAPEGKSLVVADFASIESVVLGWLANCRAIDQIFREGMDTYKVFASEYYHIPYGDVTKKQRTFSKPAVLGCGYMLGWRGLIKYAESMGVGMTEDEARRAVDTFRGMYPEIVQFWDWIDNAVREVVWSKYPVEGYRFHVERDEYFLRIRVPSGRYLSYYLPSIDTHAAPWAEYVMTTKATHTREQYHAANWTDAQLIESGLMLPPDEISNFSYMGRDTSNRWGRIHAHKGGLTENLVQSIAGDLLWNGIRNAEASWLKVVLHVHDEIVCEVPEETAEKDLQVLQAAMTQAPPWCPDMWLGTSGFVTKRYTKD